MAISKVIVGLKGFWFILLFLLLLGFHIFSASMLTGGALGAGLSFKDFAI